VLILHLGYGWLALSLVLLGGSILGWGLLLHGAGPISSLPLYTAHCLSAPASMNDSLTYSVRRGPPVG
jgi:hypothetical protein